VDSAHNPKIKIHNKKECKSMFKNFNKKRLAGAILAGVIAVTGATSAFAADTSSNSQLAAGQNRPAKMDFSKMTTTIKTAINSLVTAGTITQAQADEILKVYTPGERKGILDGARKNPMDELVTAKTITQAQADAINAAVKTGRESKKSAVDVLKELVKAGTITQTQADAVIADAVEKVFTPRERIGGLDRVRKNPIDELVTAKTITQAQADAVNAAIKAAIGSPKVQ
jgi:polyhydroxyalkanoate synthesis regulator phasin